jgi:CrcB protein
MWRFILALAIGGLLGCLLRWVLSLFLNSTLPTIPPGTLAANLIGSLAMTLAGIATVTSFRH